MKKICMITLVPRNITSRLNIGIEFIKRSIEDFGWSCDLYNYDDVIDNLNQYDIIGFNIFYNNQIFNLIPFLKNNNIEVDVNKRDIKPLLIAGGQGLGNPRPINRIIDIFALGDGEDNIQRILRAYGDNDYSSLLGVEGIYFPKYNTPITYAHIEEIKSDIVYTRYNESVIELNRGCRYKCKFCQYSYLAGKYREKPLDLVEDQLIQARIMGANRVNLMSCNLTGYRNIDKLLDLCYEHNIEIRNTDVRINEYSKVSERLFKLGLGYIKTGLESFSEETRMDVSKGITDKQLYYVMEDSMLNNDITYIHLFLIWGLPTDTDDRIHRIYEVIRDLEDMRNSVTSRQIKLDYSFTNFQPSYGTPLADSPMVDFDRKEKFFHEYWEFLKEIGKAPKEGVSFQWGNYGVFRPGKREIAYKIHMWLERGGEEINDILMKINYNGVHTRVNKWLARHLIDAGADLKLSDDALERVWK